MSTPGTRAAIVGLIGFTLRRVVAGNRVVAALAILSAGPALATIVALRSKDAPVEVFHAVSIEIGCYIAPLLLSLVYGVGLTTSEIEDGTAQYVLLAALRRANVALVQTITAALALAVMAGASVGATLVAVLLSAPADAPAARLPDAGLAARYALAAALAVAAYLPPVVAFGYAFRRAVAASVALAVAFEVIPVRMPIRLAAWSLTNNVRAVIIDLVFEGGQTYRGGRAQHLAYNSNWQYPETGDALWWIGSVAVVALIAAMIAARRRGLARGESG